MTASHEAFPLSTRFSKLNKHNEKTCRSSLCLSRSLGGEDARAAIFANIQSGELAGSLWVVPYTSHMLGLLSPIGISQTEVRKQK